MTIHPRCLVTTPWLQALNRLRELSRGDARHGSCGQGIGETRSYWLKYGEDAVFAADLRHLDRLRHKLELQRQRTLLELQDFIDRIDADVLHEFGLWELNAEAVAGDLHEALPDGLAIDAAVPAFQTAIFEGAQGVLLDEYRGFHPLHDLEHGHAAPRLGVGPGNGRRGRCRARHHPGLHDSPRRRPAADILRRIDEARLQDPGNPWNRWQGSMRCGWLDLPLIRYAAAVAGPLDGIVVNHLDQVHQGDCWVCDDYRNLTSDALRGAAPFLAVSR